MPRLQDLISDEEEEILNASQRQSLRDYGDAVEEDWGANPKLIKPFKT